MDLVYAITYLREDKQVALKMLGMAAAFFFGVVPVALLLMLFPSIGAVSLIFLPGLPVLMLASGYMLNLSANVRNGLPRPLPQWAQFRIKLVDGAHILLAMLIYHLPLTLFMLMSYAGINIVAGGILGQTLVNITAFCCSFPVMIIYLFVVWGLLGAGLSEYLETRDANRFYRIKHLLDVMQAHGKLVRQWLFYVLILNTFFFICIFIPCIGWVALPFILPVHGHLFGQFARQLHANVRVT